MKLPTVSAGKFAIHSLTFTVESPAFTGSFDECARVVVSMEVNDRDTGRRAPIRTEERVSMMALEHAKADVLKRIIYNAARKAVLHELDEWLRMDGELMGDPDAMHAPSLRRVSK